MASVTAEWRCNGGSGTGYNRGVDIRVRYNLMHILFVAPLLIYIGFIGKEKTSYVYFDLLKVLGFGVLIVFIYKLYKFYNH